MKNKIYYLCDRKNKNCRCCFEHCCHTSEINNAKNFERTTEGVYFEKENIKANDLLSQTLQGLKRICNHCQLKDCEQCWLNDICNKIIKYFETIPPVE